VPDRQVETILGTVRFPFVVRSPWWALTRRLLLASALLLLAVLIVYVSRDGYIDNADPTGQVGLVDAVYYTGATFSFTGYGDITPVTDGARLVNAFVITPLRIAFLVLLIGTTLQVAAAQGREIFRISRWRNSLNEHIVVIGYGTKGRSAIETLVANGHPRGSVVVVDPDETRRPPPRRRGTGQPGHRDHRPRRLHGADRPQRAPAQRDRVHRGVGA
jgi:voltage-gated potassium channel